MLRPVLRPVRPEEDADLLHSWVTQERARFWGMTERDRDEVAAIYGYIDGQEHLAAYLAEIDGVPLALFQTYDPFVDEIGEYYDRRPGDVGVHLFLADDPHRAGRTADLLAAFVALVAALPGARRAVAEPDVRNTASVALLQRVGFRLGPVADLPGKTAQFTFLDL
jgi:penicillin amidase